MQEILQILLPSGVALVTVIILWRTLKTHDNQLFVSNFTAITNDIGSDLTKECRALLYHSKDLIDKLEANPEINTKKLSRYNIKDNVMLARKLAYDDDVKLRALLEVIKYIASTYNRVGMLIEKDSKLKKEIMDYHGFVIGKMWIITETVVKQQNNWERGYKYFKKAYDDAYNQYFWIEFKKFRRERIEKNTNNLP